MNQLGLTRGVRRWSRRPWKWHHADWAMLVVFSRRSFAVLASPGPDGQSELESNYPEVSNGRPETQNGRPATASRSETPSRVPRVWTSGTWPNPLKH